MDVVIFYLVAPFLSVEDKLEPASGSPLPFFFFGMVVVRRAAR